MKKTSYVCGIDKVVLRQSACSKHGWSLLPWGRAKIQQGLIAMQPVLRRLQKDIVTLASDATADIKWRWQKSYGHRGYWSLPLTSQRRQSMFTVCFLGIQHFARSFWNERKACYAATAGLSYAKLHVAAHPESKVLVIASDIARYGVGSSGESAPGSCKPAIVSQNHVFWSFVSVGWASWCHELLASRHSSALMFKGVYSIAVPWQFNLGSLPRASSGWSLLFCRFVSTSLI